MAVLLRATKIAALHEFWKRFPWYQKKEPVTQTMHMLQNHSVLGRHKNTSNDHSETFQLTQKDG